ncbi:oleate hydratase [Massilia genomosp. 1]|uniref:Oleate hydratase n=1 Tax=Massilia genomosp. 1 TaxID=2609280 RepID=A0ABX0MYL8_9BURK|nr:oleate hydratase [Massilia genomosp. 1]NHZ65331.1 oleate hydratase [Massilia genomosp. 1]
MHYSSGNYEAFVRPRKAAGADNKSAWFVGSGLASLAGAAFLIRDAGVAGQRITILEQQAIAGGALDGLKVPEKGFVIRGGREMEQHFECLWDLYHSIPSLEIEGASVLDEFYRLDKDDPNVSLQRVTQDCGGDVADKALLTLNEGAQKNLLSVFLASHESMENKRIDEVFGADFLSSNFWLYWRTMFAFEEWHSALEMKLYLHRFIHHIGGLADFSSLKFNRYNQYESMVLPLVKWLQEHGVVFRYGVEVTDVQFDIAPGRKQATRIDWREHGVAGGVGLGADDLLFVTIGSLTENSDNGDHHTPARLNEGPAPAWDLWRRIAAKDGAFGRPDVFGAHIAQTKWESATITTLDARIPPYIEKIAKRDPFSGKVVTAGIVTVKDSAWLMSWTMSRQPHFKQQPKHQLVGWLYALFVDVPGDYVKKPMQDCSGEEITQEWLYHLGVPVEDIAELAATAASTVPVMMPYITAFFMPRQAGDRPAIVPADAANFAFIGQFAQTRERDCIFTTEYSVRTAMEAVYTLLDVERGVPEVFNSTYDIRTLLATVTPLRDGKQLDIPGPAFLREYFLRKLEGTEISALLKEFKLIAD